KGEALLSRAEIGKHLAAGAEAGVKSAVAVVAHQREIVTSVDIRLPSHDDLTVSLYRNGVRLGTDPREVSDHFATRAESAVEGAVGVIAHQHEVVEKAEHRASYYDDFSVRLYGNRSRLLIGTSDIGGYFATCTESGVEAAIAVVARQREVKVSIDVGVS